jgi:hypothetical protein
MELIPNVNGLHAGCLNPDWVSIVKNASPSGNASTDSGK